MAGRAQNKERPVGAGTSFRRLEERVRTTAPAPIAWGAGLLLGVVFGVGFAGWEAAILRGAGLAYATGDRGLVVVGASYVVVGGVLGLAAAAGLLWSTRWATAGAFLAAGWVASAKVAAGLSEAGVPGVVGIAIVLGAALVLGQLAGRLPAPPWAHLGPASLALVALAVLAPLHAHLLPQGTSGGALVVSAVAVLCAVPLAAAAAFSTGDGRPPIVPALGFAAVGWGLAWLAGGREPPRWSGAAEGPPIVVVVVSGLRADRTGLGGYGRPTTPNLDALGRGALVYEQAHANSNWSVPALGSLLTGRLPYEHGAGLNSGWQQLHTPLRPDVRTVAQVLGGAGYARAAVVADPALRRYALDAGFQAWSDAPPDGALPVALMPLVAADLLPWSRSPAERVTDRALEVVASAPDAGWFLLVQYGDAGGPIAATRADEEGMGFTTRPWPNDLYDAALRRVDRELGRLVEGLPPDAWLVVVGDRGVHLGEERPSHVSGRPGARFGATLYEELLHVPLVVRGPGVKPGRAPEPVSQVDVAATLLRIAGLEPSAEADGSPLGRPFGEDEVERVMIAQSSGFGVEQQAAIVGRHKIVQTADGRTPLFDLVANPAETAPVPKDGALDNLQRRLLAMLPPAGSGYQLQDAPPVLLQVGQLANRYATGGPP